MQCAEYQNKVVQYQIDSSRRYYFTSVFMVGIGLRLRNLDVDLLRTFVSVIDFGGFTRAADVLLRRQSTLSLQIKRLEDVVGRRLVDRTTRYVRLTTEGAAILPFARQMIDLNDRLLAGIDKSAIDGTVKFGTSEHFAAALLPAIVASFIKNHPTIHLEVTCDFVVNLMNRFRQNELDLVLVKRESGRADRGVRIWREALIWATSEGITVPRDGPLPLVLSPPPCVYRKRATEVLSQSGRAWRISYSCTSFAGQQAAVQAGLGITVLPKGMTLPGLVPLASDVDLPDLRDIEIALIAARQLSPPAQRLRDHVALSIESMTANHS